MKRLCLAFFLVGPLMWLSCTGEDRSDEQPLVPGKVYATVTECGDSCIVNGFVGESHNSALTECGFYWGNDTLSNLFIADEASYNFSMIIDSVNNGTYYAVPYATNGIGTTYGDTVHFIILH